MPYPRANTSAINRAPYKYGHKKHENNSKNFQPLPLQPSTCPLLYKEIGLDLAISYCTRGARRYINGQRFACSVRATEQFAVKKFRRKNICIYYFNQCFFFWVRVIHSILLCTTSDTEGGRLPCFSALHCFGLSLCFGLCLCPFLRSSCCLLFANLSPSF